jgi:hypothetical protein
MVITWSIIWLYTAHLSLLPLHGVSSYELLNMVDCYIISSASCRHLEWFPVQLLLHRKLLSFVAIDRVMLIAVLPFVVGCCILYPAKLSKQPLCIQALLVDGWSMTMCWWRYDIWKASHAVEDQLRCHVLDLHLCIPWRQSWLAEISVQSGRSFSSQTRALVLRLSATGLLKGGCHATQQVDHSQRLAKTWALAQQLLANLMMIDGSANMVVQWTEVMAHTVDRLAWCKHVTH